MKLTRETGYMIISYICNTSINESEQYIKDEALKFLNSGTDAELYDFLKKLSKEPVERIKDENGNTKICIGYISGFTQTLCSMVDMVERPDEGQITTLSDSQKELILGERWLKVKFK